METSVEESSNESAGNVLVRALRRWLLHSSRVVAVESLSANFRLIDLQGDALKEVEWLPGQQIQITTGAGLVGRTYTPMSWDRDRGFTRILIFLHGDGPGCTWARSVRTGGLHDFFGPTRQLKLVLEEPFTLFGDETAFGLGLALQNAATADVRPRFLFEVCDLEESRRALESIGLRDASLIKRENGGEHLAEVASRLSGAADELHQIALTGNARSIQRIKKSMAMRAERVPRFAVKPYWSPGKTGMS
jgi:ferric-chelate reductase (NADPH)